MPNNFFIMFDVPRALLVNGANFLTSLCVLLSAASFWSFRPSIIAAEGDQQHVTHNIDEIHRPMLMYETIDHFEST